MRMTLRSATVVAIVLTAGLAILHAQTQPPLNSVAPAAPRATSGNNVAVIDIGYIFKNHDRFKSAMDEIKKDFESFEKYVRDQQTVIQNKAEQLKGLPAGSDQYGALEEEIAEASTKLRLDMGRKQKERVDREAKVYFNAYKEIEWFVQKFADRYGIDLVVRFNSEEMDPNKPESVLQGINRFIVFNRGLDISNPILAELKGPAQPAQPPVQQGRAQPAPGTPQRRVQ